MDGAVNEEGGLATQDDWAKLMARVQAGDSAAYRQLLSAIAPYLRAIARRHHRDQRDVEDSVQDILLTVHMVRHTYDPGRPFRPWLAAIANRRVIDRLRVQRRTRARENILDASHETFPAPETNQEEAASDSRALHLAVASLPERQRQAIQLTKLKEMSLKEAADETGQSVTALKIATHRALKSLRRLLEGEAPRA